MSRVRGTLAGAMVAAAGTAAAVSSAAAAAPGRLAARWMCTARQVTPVPASAAVSCRSNWAAPVASLPCGWAVGRAPRPPAAGPVAPCRGATALLITLALAGLGWYTIAAVVHQTLAAH